MLIGMEFNLQMQLRKPHHGVEDILGEQGGNEKNNDLCGRVQPTGNRLRR